jgi:glucose uptake protein
MVLVDNYPLAVVFFVLTMICWGSWSNTQKLAEKTWRFELFYWDFALGLVLLSIVAGLTLGTFGSEGRTFSRDLAQASAASIGWAMLGGAVWNAGNLLLVAAIAEAGMAVAFPVGGGIAWLGGILFNFILEVLGDQVQGNPLLLLVGSVIIFVAIILSMLAYMKLASKQERTSARGILLSVGAGLFIAFFYGFVVKSLDPQFLSSNFDPLVSDAASGKLGPYSGVFIFTLGAFLTTFLFNPYFMRHPVQGPPVTFSQYFKGALRTHLIGALGGVIWTTGMVMSFMAVREGGPAVSYALSNAAPVVAIIWGVFVWKEFKDAPKGTDKLLAVMFLLYLVGLVIITYSRISGG